MYKAAEYADAKNICKYKSNVISYVQYYRILWVNIVIHYALCIIIPYYQGLT